MDKQSDGLEHRSQIDRHNILPRRKTELVWIIKHLILYLKYYTHMYKRMLCVLLFDVCSVRDL